MDQQAIQALIDAAIAGAQQQHQADLNAANQQHANDLAAAVLLHQQALQAANAANAQNLANAIAGLPAPPAAPGGGGGVAAPFALTPGLANPNVPWDYARNEGLKLFGLASAKLLPEPYNGGVKDLKMLLVALKARGEGYGWNQHLFTISNQAVPNPQNKDLLTQYGVLTLPNVQAHAAVYLGTQTRPAQMSIQVKSSIMASLGPASMLQLLARHDDYTIGGEEDGTTMVKVLISITVIETRATLSVLRAELRELPALLRKEKSNIITFNAAVDDKVTSLRAMDEECQDLLTSLFTAYQSASDHEFVKYIKDVEVRWENNEIAALTTDNLMQLAVGRYNVMKAKGTWMKPSKETSDLMALKASIIELEANQAEVKKPAASSGASTRTRAAARANTGEFEWKNVAPVAGEKEKTFKGKVYVPCPFHPKTKWVLKAGHEGGCKLDPKYKGADKPEEKKGKEPTKQALQFAHALVFAMEQEEDGALGEEPPKE
jgi:hypothetical protein